MALLKNTFTKPGAISETAALTVGVCGELLVFAFDVMTGKNVHVETLYFFPLVIASLHTRSVVKPLILLAGIGLLRFGTAIFIGYNYPSAEYFVIDVLNTVVTSILTIILSRQFRHHYERANFLSLTDPLTSIRNRRGFEEALGTEISQQRRYGGRFSLVVIDLDGFKEINDVHGHAVGDQVLILVAKALQKHIRQTDIVSRLGGDEFAVLMLHADSIACLGVCQTLIQKISEFLNENGTPATASIGCITFDSPPESALAAFQAADRAMYEAKKKGKGRVVCH